MQVKLQNEKGWITPKPYIGTPKVEETVIICAKKDRKYYVGVVDAHQRISIVTINGCFMYLSFDDGELFQYPDKDAPETKSVLFIDDEPVMERVRVDFIEYEEFLGVAVEKILSGDYPVISLDGRMPMILGEEEQEKFSHFNGRFKKLRVRYNMQHADYAGVYMLYRMYIDNKIPNVIVIHSNDSILASYMVSLAMRLFYDKPVLITTLSKMDLYYSEMVEGGRGFNRYTDLLQEYYAIYTNVEFKYYNIILRKGKNRYEINPLTTSFYKKDELKSCVNTDDVKETIRMVTELGYIITHGGDLIKSNGTMSTLCHFI